MKTFFLDQYKFIFFAFFVRAAKLISNPYLCVKIGLCVFMWVGGCGDIDPSVGLGEVHGKKTKGKYKR